MIWLVLFSVLGALGCTATCVRDSDCLGDSVCSNNRCLLIVRGDAGPGGGAPLPASNDPLEAEPSVLDAAATEPEATGS